jgi:epoxyqueuosine reductase
MSSADWNKLDENQFKNLFKNSAVKRTKYKGLKRNITFLNEKKKE